MKRLLSILGLALFALWGAVLPAHAHDVKDPVCRMTVDSDTAKYRHKLGNRTFYFCSQQCQVSFSRNPAKYEKLADQLEKQDLHTYRVELTTAGEAVARRPVTLEFAVRYADKNEPVKEFETIHERLFHLIMTTEDMSWFEHQHPVKVGDGKFRLTWTFPRPGKYRLYADFTPADGDNQVLPLSLEVGGGPGKTLSLTPDAKRVKQVGDLRFELKLQGEPLRMEKPLLMTYVIRDRSGRPVRDLQPFIGAMGHLLAISQDGKEVVHTHALQSVSQPAMPGEKEPFRVTRAMVTEKGPAQSFKLTLPSGGLYKTWAQFARNGKVYTVPFTFMVQDLWGKGAPAASPAKGASRVCPVMEHPVEDPSKAPKLLVNNEPVYFCCAGCADPVKKEPAKYLKTVKDPVTGESFRVTGQTPKMEHSGGLFLFRSRATHEKFHADPGKYVKHGPQDGKQEHQGHR
jgi:YHS domain-containing protein